MRIVRYFWRSLAALTIIASGLTIILMFLNLRSLILWPIPLLVATALWLAIDELRRLRSTNIPITTQER